MCRNGTIPQRALEAVGVATGEKEGRREREQKNLVAQQDLANVTQRAQLTVMESELNLR